jgi:NAD-dependent deacetylase
LPVREGSVAELQGSVVAALDEAAAAVGPLVFLTGAGISAESGIPTFRGPEGYWRVGSANYQPEELARSSAFEAMPDEIWAWYLHRRSVCRAAAPNAAHLVLARLEGALGERFALITQNVDGLHARAGNTRARTYEIHGNTDFMRCAAGCRPAALVPIPAEIPLEWPKGRALGDAERSLLRCRRCGERTRPHVLWFDEYYDEELFRAASALEVAASAALLVVVGTSGQTTLPVRIVANAGALGTPVLVVNLEASPFSEAALPGGDLRGTATEWIPRLAARLLVS